jgi:hypothetical protein
MHAVLADRAGWGFGRAWAQMFLSLELLIVAVLGGVGTAAVIADGKPERAPFMVGAIASFGLRVVVPFSIAATLALRLFRPAVRVRDGVVDVWFDDTAFERRHFSTLKWYMGTLLFSGYSSSPIWRTVYLVLPDSIEQSHDDESMQRGRS